MICKIKHDKSKGEYIYKDNHFHSQKCLDEFLKSKEIKDKEIAHKSDNSSNSDEIDNNIEGELMTQWMIFNYIKNIFIYYNI